MNYQNYGSAPGSGLPQQSRKYLDEQQHQQNI